MVRHLAGEPTSYTSERLRGYWGELNARYFRNSLPPIEITWSQRLTSSAGMFVSDTGPRSKVAAFSDPRHRRRRIRLSTRLLQHQPEQEIIGTLAHEMIHQWQFDVLKRCPDHGPDFRRKMELMNRDGLAITIRHTLDAEVEALAKYAWQCLRCGSLYHRQRRTIRSRRHRCVCSGTLKEVPSTEVERLRSSRHKAKNHARSTFDVRTFGLSTTVVRPVQLELNFPIP
ncbi:MAG: SprT-like domain-containing protein [Nitrospiraceae bacterium]